VNKIAFARICYKGLILKGFQFFADFETRAENTYIQRENAFFPRLSTKLSTDNVDKKEKVRVYGHLGQMRRFYMRFLLQCMIKWHGNGAVCPANAE
jgi:hypothetical protein